MSINWYAFTRYYFVRQIYGFFRSISESKEKIDKDTNSMLKCSGFDVKRAALSMKKESWTKIPDLSKETVKSIYEYSLKAPGRRPSFNKDEVIYFNDVVDGKLSKDDPAIMLRIHPDQCKEINDLMSDKILLGLAQGYLGYKPKHVEAQLLWSFHSVEMDLKERHKLAQAVYYHWDSMAVNGFRVNYYLTDVDESSGAHVLLPRSHKKKPLRYLFARSTTVEEKPLLDYYGKKEVITGKAGSGFAQDVNGFHKALPPKSADRLHLHIRYT